MDVCDSSETNDTDASDRTTGSNEQIESKRAGSLIAKNLHSNQGSPETFTAECFTTKTSVVCSSPTSSNKSLQQLKLSEFEMAELSESTETNVHDRSVNEILSQEECGIQTQSHVEMDSAARNAESDDEGDVLANVQVKPAASQEKETKAPACSKHKIYSSHSYDRNWVYEINKDRRPVCEQPRFSEKTRNIS